MTHRNHHEREFEAFLAGEESELARLYRRLPQAEPDAKLDAAVLNLARAAVEPQRVNALRHAKLRHPRPWWLVGLSSAAGVVLAAGIAWQMRHGFDGHPAANMAPPPSPAAQSGREVIPISAITPPPEAAAPPAAAAATPPAPAVVSDNVSGAAAAKPQQQAQRLAKSAAPQRDAELAKTKTEAAADSAPPRPVATEPPPAPAAAAPPALAQASPAEVQAQSAAAGTGSDELAARSDQGGTAAAPQPFADSDRAPDHNSVERKAAIASGSRREEYGLSAEEAVTGEALARPEARQRAAPAREPSDKAADSRVADTLRYSEQAPKKTAAAAPPPPSPEPAPVTEAAATEAPAVVVAAPPAPAAAAPAPAAPPTAATRAAAMPPAAAATTAAAPPAGAAALGGISDGNGRGSDETARRAAALEHNAKLAPAKWVEQIQQLLREQRRDEARENLDLFRKRHPGYVLPAELRALK